MSEVATIPWNGLTVASTFAGGGGSSTGYKMAGFKVLYANEFVDAARATYRANHPDAFLDGRDVREVTPQSLLDACQLTQGQLDVLDGSPPCQPFSTAGRREKKWGKTSSHSGRLQKSADDLFFEYIRLVDGVRPKVFVAENVSGLVKGVAKGYFLDILKRMKGIGYIVEARLLDAQWLGVPQTRQRVIFLGVREDLGFTPTFPMPLPYRYSVREAIPWIDGLLHDTGGQWSQGEKIDSPCPTVMNGVNAVNANHFKVSVIHENGGFKRTECADTPSPTVTATQCRMSVETKLVHVGGRNVGDEHSLDDPSPGIQAQGVAGSSTEQVVLQRARVRLPDGFGAEKWVDAGDGPYTCVGTAPSFGCNLNSNGGKIEVPIPGGVERRKFTIAELKRICSFPDDYVLVGSYAQQWERLGNSVPPLMMRAIASAVRDSLVNHGQKTKAAG